MELRSPDPAANPYLAIAIALMAGLDGIKNKIEPPAHMDENASSMTEEERKQAGIVTLPDTLMAAIEAFREDPFMEEVLGSHVYHTYLEEKLNDYEDKWYSKFSKMETALAKLQSNSSAVTSLLGGS